MGSSQVHFPFLSTIRLLIKIATRARRGRRRPRSTGPSLDLGCSYDFSRHAGNLARNAEEPPKKVTFAARLQVGAIDVEVAEDGCAAPFGTQAHPSGDHLFRHELALPIDADGFLLQHFCDRNLLFTGIASVFSLKQVRAGMNRLSEGLRSRP